MPSWTQLVYRKETRQGLGASYTAGGDVHSFIRKILSLPHLPSEHITRVFDSLQTLAEQGANYPIVRLIEYVQSTWVSGLMWKPDNWSVFRETVRTNNDVEGNLLHHSSHL